MNHLATIYKMKGVGKPQYYLGGDVADLGEEWQNKDIYCAFSAETYIRNCLPKLAEMCGLTQSSMKKTSFSDFYHPELDESACLRPNETTKFKSLIGSGNWLITLGRFDIQFAITTLAQYSVVPQRRTHESATQSVWLFGQVPIRKNSY